MKNPQKMADDNLYNVPVIPPDLRRDETIQQICNALDYLDQVADDVFQRISSRVTENHTKLKNINDRVNHAQAKIDKIKGTSKATRVFSSAKYPAVKDEESYHSVFNKSTHKKPQLKTTTKVQSKHLQVDDKVLKEKLQFYNVQLSTKKSQANQESQGEGLGRLPENIPSVSSLLLFNTSENPYKKYVMFDPLGVVTKTRKSLDDQDDGLADAPSTITHREELQRQSTENYFYMPGLGEVPEIAVPDFLPDLAGIADDISYSADSGRAIAPSVPGSNMPDLPSVIPDIESIPSGPAPVIGGDGPPPPPPPGPPSDIPPPPPPPAGAPPPPPPPPPSAPPPPPPPPPPAEAPPPPPPGGAPPPPPPQGVPAPAAAPDTGRASLLDAIRNAGGAGKAKLRDAKVRKIESKKKKQEEKEQAVASVGGGDLMSALAAKLSMRRKGISGSGKPGAGGGNEDKSNSGSGGAMDRISAMIPPPPTAGSAPDKGGEEEDWS